MDAIGTIVAALLAREYLRVSHDRSGREKSNGEQQEDNRATWPSFEWGDHYGDVGSASRYATKPRGDFDQLIADLRADRFGADVLVLWENSRGSRRVGEWVELIDLCETRGVKIAVTSHHRIYDPSEPRDRRSLIDDANDSEYESAKTSKRVRRDMARNAADGRPHGRHTYGYRREYAAGARGPVLVAVEPDPQQAPVIAELFERLERGHSLKEIARDFDTRGIRNKSGGPFSPQHLRWMARNPAYKGVRTHNGEEHPAVWPALVSKARWHAVSRLLSDPARRTSRSGRAKHFLSGIVPCDVCSGPLAVESRNGRPTYRCHGGRHVAVAKAELDDYAERAILGFLAHPENYEKLATDEGNDVELAEVRDQIAEVRAELDDLADRLGRGDISATLAAKAEPQILDRLHKLEAREAELSTPSRLRGLITPGEDVAERWEAAPLSAKREIARTLLSLDLLGELRVQQSPTPGRPVPIQQRVTWRTA